MRHALTYAIADYVAAAIAEAVAKPGSWERDAATARARDNLDRIDAIVAKLTEESP